MLSFWCFVSSTVAVAIAVAVTVAVAVAVAVILFLNFLKFVCQSCHFISKLRDLGFTITQEDGFASCFIEFIAAVAISG